MNDFPIYRFLSALSEYHVKLDIDRVLDDPGAFFYALAKALPFVIELLEDHYHTAIENIKLGDLTDEFDS